MPIVTNEQDPDLVKSLVKGIAVIEAFDENNRSLTLSDVAKRTGISRASARRFLHTLTFMGYATQTGTHFSLTAKVLNLGFSYLSSQGLSEIAKPFMQSLSDDTQESCSLAVLSDADIIYTARIPTKRIMTISPNIGSRLPAYISSMGRVLLAGLPVEQLESILDGASLQQYTPRTIVDKDELLAAIEEVRGQQWAMIDQELELGLRTISAPIVDWDGKVIAAVNLATPSSAVTKQALLKEFLPKLQLCCKQISFAFNQLS